MRLKTSLSNYVSALPLSTSVVTGGREFFLDLLFYPLELRSFVVIDLKARALEPEFAGKMNFHVLAVDAILRCPIDYPGSSTPGNKIPQQDDIVVVGSLREGELSPVRRQRE